MSNLVKTSYFNIDHTDRRTIDTNAIIEKKLELMRQEEQRRAQAGFELGLAAENIDGNGGALYGETGDLDNPEAALFADNQPAADISGESVVFKSGIGAGAHIDTQAIIDQANAQAENLIADANARAESILEQARQEAEEIKSQAYSEGANAGYNDGFAKGEAENEQLRAELESKAAGLDAQFEQMVKEVEPLMVDTITDVYQSVFDVDLSGLKQIIIHLIGNTIHRIEGATSFLVHVSADDYAAVSAEKNKLEESSGRPGSFVEVIEDVSLGKNQCFIETDGGIFDCSLDTELSELASKLRLLSYQK